VAEEDTGAALFELGEAVERGVHRAAVVHVFRQTPLAQGAAEIASIGSQHDLARGKPQFQRLVPRRVTVGRQAHDRAVAEHVVLAIDLQNLMAEVVILTVKAALRGDVRIQSGLPFAALNDDGRVRDQCVTADMVEM
jgi:hypothetical protein